MILVDDGLATGSTMLAAALAVKEQHPGRVVVAVPVADPDVCDALRAKADEAVCLLTPRPLRAVGMWYRDFSQTTDEEVRELVNRLQGAAETSRGPEQPRAPGHPPR